MSDIEVALGADGVATIEMQRPPDNFFDLQIVRDIADAVEALERDPSCRAIVLCADGKNFCAGAKLGGDNDPIASAAGLARNPLYDEAVRLFSGEVPIICAVQGAAVGGGLGVALVGDFRIASTDAKFSSNFARLGLHQGFGISVTLPRIVGQQKALDLMYTGRRIGADEALSIGLVDAVVALEELRDAALAKARDIAGSAPLSVRSIRRTMRGDLGELVRTATDREHHEQIRLRATDDYQEGVRAYAERRPPEFKAR